MKDNSHKKKLIKIVILNSVIYLLLLIVYFITGFLLNSDPAKKYGSDAGLLFVMMILVHIFLNYIILQRQALASLRNHGTAAVVIVLAWLVLLL